jgi:hypothetical protein
MRKVTAKTKLSPADYAARFAAEKALQQRAIATRLRYGKRAAANSAGAAPRAAASLMRALRRRLLAQHAQWRARHDVLAATPANIGKPERAARQAMPSDLSEKSDARRSE